jgi:hypothetical protein
MYCLWYVIIVHKYVNIQLLYNKVYTYTHVNLKLLYYPIKQKCLVSKFDKIIYTKLLIHTHMKKMMMRELFIYVFIMTCLQNLASGVHEDGTQQ